MVEWKKLGEVFETRNGYTPSTKDDGFWVGGTIPWFKMDDIRDCGTIFSDSKLHVTEKAIKGKGLFKANSIILATSATIGEHALITIEHLCNQRFTNFYPKEGFAKSINMKYIYYYMFLVDKWCQQHTHQGGFASVDMDGLYKLPIPIPSLSEQTRIVGILDTFTASIDNLKQQIAQRRKQYEHCRDQLLNLEGKEGVEMKTLGDLCDYVDYRGKTPHKVEKGVFLVTAKNIRKGFIDYCNSKEYIAEEDYANVMRRGLPKIGDVLITTEAPCGNVAQIDNENVALAQRVIKYRPRDLSLNPSYLKFILLGEYFQTKLDKEATGGTVKGIKGSKLHKMTIPVPALPEQQRIVSILDTFEASIANLEQQLVQREKQYEYYRNKLLTFE